AGDKPPSDGAGNSLRLPAFPRGRHGLGGVCGPVSFSRRPQHAADRSGGTASAEAPPAVSPGRLVALLDREGPGFVRHLRTRGGGEEGVPDTGKGGEEKGSKKGKRRVPCWNWMIRDLRTVYATARRSRIIQFQHGTLFLPPFPDAFLAVRPTPLDQLVQS